MLIVQSFYCVMLVAVPVSLTQAQAPSAQEQKSLMQEKSLWTYAQQRPAAQGKEVIDSLHRVDGLNRRQQHPKPQKTNAHQETAAKQKMRLVATKATKPVRSTIVPPRHFVPQPTPALRQPEPMGSQYDGEGQDALRSDFPGLSIRIPSHQTKVQF